MIIFINGPFGIGKTTTAKLLQKQMGGALLFDPEIIGSWLQLFFGKIKPVKDFQEYRLWTVLTIAVAALLLKVTKRPLIIPMTILHEPRWKVIHNYLRKMDGSLVSVRLICSEEILRQRILRRPDAEGSHAWCLQHVAKGLEMMSNARFGQAIETGDKTPQQVVDVLKALIATRKS